MTGGGGVAVRKPHKYSAVKTVVDGITLDSKLEAAVYGRLKLRERAGDLWRLVVHPEWKLIVCGVQIGKYRADFSFYDDHGFHVVDAKGVRTPVYMLKRKLMKAIYQIDIEEVRK